MFKKLKDKLAEEVKSSPQRIQQFAQAAQAAVTSASSSISDITNSDLFSIADNDGQQPRSTRLQPSPSGRQNTFHDVALAQPVAESLDYASGQEILDNQRHRRLSNSSLASDISFRLPSYESPSMYHLQSDMEVTASEAEESGFASGAVSLDRVTKEQLYAAYRRTQERYKKYRTQYGDLARHYKLLERENAKARSVLVETQDKALRRISELKEQCSLEQSAKAHLEKALRVEIEEKIMKIDALNTKVKILQNNIDISDDTSKTDKLNKEAAQKDNDVQLINLSIDNESKASSDESSTTEITNLNNKMEKLEQLLNKYKESLKNSKEKNSQLAAELQILSNELENKNKEVEQFQTTSKQLEEAIQKIQDLSNENEDLQNKINTYDFAKTKETSTLEMDLQRAKEEIAQLQSKIEVFGKREEEYAISLAENKLSIHKELENKEAEIKSLKDNLSSTQKEIQSLNIVINDYKINLLSLEEERSKLLNENNEYNTTKSKIIDLESQLQELNKKYQLQEQIKTKADEEYKCLQLQLKQETAEKLAMIDRNGYLENKNKHLSEENAKKSSQISSLENELQLLKNTNHNVNIDDIEIKKQEMTEELEIWKSKCKQLESEIQEEREELIKLQSEIEKLLANDEFIQNQNIELRETLSNLKIANAALQDQVTVNDRLKISLKMLPQYMFLDIEKDIKDILINNTLQQELQNESEHNSRNTKTIASLQDEINKLKDDILKIDLEKDSVNESKKNVDKLYEAALNDIELLKYEQKDLVSKIQENANKSKILEFALDEEKAHALSVIENITVLNNEKKNLEEKLNTIESKNKCFTEEIENLKKELDANFDKLVIITKENKELKEKSIIAEDKNKHYSEEIEKENDLDDSIEKYTTIAKENKKLKEKSEELDRTILHVDKLQDNIKSLSEENNSLKKQIEKIAANIKDQEAEIIELRKSHGDIENEKDRLSAIIEKLESTENRKSFVDACVQHTQPKEIIDTNETNQRMVSSLLSQDNNGENENEINDNITPEIYITLKNKYDELRDENRRLQSDVEGLQKYLTKISKENSVLNDKLREFIASSEYSTENDISNDIANLRNEVQTSRDKIDNLLRENSLLIEENYELKDQLQSQNYSSATETKTINNNDNDLELSNIKEKYKNLVQTNTKAEQKLLESEQLNRSLTSNMQQTQDKYEKLKMINEKLERKLDEALVSLRHLHSLQENTELEYLRNILYEYLTGSGMHSITLAKVLSAIVKFDDSQTQLVLQKEKERQGFLRQLGLI
ncbi:LOW QUALITY PROTEIN: golgin subfamily A member 4 [Manduca sexta]|uniref:LOW QUALITY PROTEIN: golgin subfamily A member 4 n=1 Tax=Manduca sexta TaxID=7130 RepID=UPI001890770C|nr:LOW QUALITY PROTEIN: golgin subfamily A member 4 [Manduca sexta]